MKRLIKILLAFIAVIIVLAVIAAAALMIFFDPNAYKDTISQQIQTKSGYSVELKGKISWKFQPQLGLQVKNVVVYNPAGFKPKKMATLDAINFSIKPLPLLHKQVVVRRLDLYGLDLKLIKKANGETNWQKPAKSKHVTQTAITNESQTTTIPVKSAEKKSTAKYKVTVDQINFHDAVVHYNDRSQKKSDTFKIYKLTSKNINSKNLPFSISSQFDILREQGKLSSQFNLDSKLQFDQKQQSIALQSFSLKGSVHGDELPEGKTNINIQTHGEIDIEKKNIQLEEFTGKLNNLTTKGSVNGNWDTQVFSGKLSIDQFDISQFLEKIGKQVILKKSNILTLSQADFDFKYTKNDFSISNLKSKLGDSSVNGKLQYVIQPQMLKFDLDVDLLNLNDYKSMQITPAQNNNSTPAAAPAKTKPAAVNPPPASSKPKLAVVEANPVVKSNSNNFNFNGNLKVAKLIFGKITATQVTGKLGNKNGAYNFNSLRANIYKGKFNGDFVIDSSRVRPIYRVNGNFANIQIQPLLEDLLDVKDLTGVANINTNVSMSGNTKDQILQTLRGSTSITTQQGSILGFNAENLMQGAYDTYKKTQPGKRRSGNTNYTTLTANFDFKDGIAYNNHIQLQAAIIAITGKGTINLISNKINYSLEAAFLGHDLLDVFKMQELAGGKIPFKVTGTLQKPKVKVNLPAMLRRMSDLRMGKKLENITDDIGDVGDDIGKKLEKTGKELKKSLKSLFGQ